MGMTLQAARVAAHAGRREPGFAEAPASGLMLVDAHGTDRHAGADGGFAAFDIHSQIHALHPHARCILHTHMPYATAIT